MLRRADWRFLTDNPAPARTLCLADGPLAAAVEMVSGEVIRVPGRLTNACDLAVLVNPDPAKLRAAWSALEPGGVCYSEWSLHPNLTPASVRRRVESAGFRSVSCYWAWPPPGVRPVREWLPLDSRGALAYFFKCHLATRGAPRSARIIASRLLPLARATGLLRPLCVVAHKSPPGSRNASVLLLTGGPRSISKVVELIFDEPDPWPRLAVKHARIPEAAPRLRREAIGLTAASGLTGVPRLVFEREDHAGFAIGETTILGEPMYRRVSAATYRNLALRGTDWLAQLAAGRQPSPPSGWWDRLVGSVIRRFEAEFAGVVDPNAVATARSALSTLGSLPLVLEQRDFAPWNLLITRSGELGVLDWESCEPAGLPLLDLVYFLAYLTFRLDRITGPVQRFAESYRASLDTRTLPGRVWSECIARYLSMTGLNVTDVEPLRVLTWMIHAHSDYEHAWADYGGPPPATALRSSLFLTLWQQEVHRTASEYHSRKRLTPSGTDTMGE